MNLYKNKYKKYKSKYNKLKYGGTNEKLELLKRTPNDSCTECGILLKNCGEGSNQCYSFHLDSDKLVGCYSKEGLCGAAINSLERGNFSLPHNESVDSQLIIDKLDCKDDTQESTRSTGSTRSTRDSTPISREDQHLPGSGNERREPLFHVGQVAIYRGPVLGWEGTYCRILGIQTENDSYVYDISCRGGDERLMAEEDRLSIVETLSGLSTSSRSRSDDNSSSDDDFSF